MVNMLRSLAPDVHIIVHSVKCLQVNNVHALIEHVISSIPNCVLVVENIDEN